jgi:hypothetical protein
MRRDGILSPISEVLRDFFMFFKCKEIYLFPKTSKPDLGPTQAFHSIGTRAKLPEHEADYSPPSTAEVKNDWSYTSTHPTSLQGMYKNNFTFLSQQYQFQ